MIDAAVHPSHGLIVAPHMMVAGTAVLSGQLGSMLAYASANASDDAVSLLEVGLQLLMAAVAPDVSS